MCDINDAENHTCAGAVFDVPLLLPGAAQHVGHPVRGGISEVDEYIDTKVLPGH